MRCVRATNDVALAKRWLKALKVLRVEHVEIEATGDWTDKKGHSAFLGRGGSLNSTVIEKIGRRWCVLKRHGGAIYDARPLRDTVTDHGLIQITWDEE